MKIVTLIGSAIWSFFCSVGEARYAAELARNQKWQQAQDLYRD
jgi:hypothetical protein